MSIYPPSFQASIPDGIFIDLEKGRSSWKFSWDGKRKVLFSQSQRSVVKAGGRF